MLCVMTSAGVGGWGVVVCMHIILPSIAAVFVTAWSVTDSRAYPVAKAS